jgi:NADPH-dependent curcumin reductase CurA
VGFHLNHAERFSNNLSKMKAVIVKEVNGAATVVDDVDVPEPADNQILCKSIYTALNPVYEVLSSHSQ